MAEGEILEEEAVTPEEEAAILGEEAGETQQLLMTSCRDNNPHSSTEIEGNPKLSCRNGRSTGASIGLPHK